MRGILTAAVLLLALSVCRAQQPVHAIYAPPYLKSSAYTRRQADAFSFTNNAAALAFTPKFLAGVYSERPFLLPELSFSSLAVAFSGAGGGLGLSLTHMGGAAYSETAAGLAYGRKLGERAAAGVRFSGLLFNAGAYGRATVVSAEAGFLLQLTEQLQTGIRIANPAGGTFGRKGNEKVPALYAMGLGYDVSDQLCLTALVEKVEGYPVMTTISVQYQPVPRLFCRAGIATAPSLFYIGGGVHIRSFRLQAVAALHAQLGLSPGLVFLFHPSSAK